MQYDRKKIYWILQFSGWLLFVLVNILLNSLYQALSWQVIVLLFYAFLFGITGSHLYRNIIVKYKWLGLGLTNLFIRFIFSSLCLGLLYQVLLRTVTFLIYGSIKINLIEEIPGFLNISFVFVVWSLIYFLVHFIVNYKSEEIKNLKWEAAKNEFELNNLKSQLNPHFMFNSMNSIRALVDEDPEKAKIAVTRLSNILRTSLHQNKEKLISFEDDLNLVKDYLSLEEIRYEDRLKTEFQIDPLSYGFLLPPLMVQTLVENAIKHGISKLVEGGKIKIHTQVINQYLHIIITNTGEYSPAYKSDSGFGIKNTKERLELIYGNKAAFAIRNNDNEVITELIIPKV